MDVVLGLVFWGGLLLLTLNWLARTMSGGHHTDVPARPHTRAVPPHGGTPPSRVGGSRVSESETQQLREDEALADGLVIGYFLARDHYQDHVDLVHDQIDELAGERDHWLEAAAAGDDLDDELDYAEFDALGGLGVEPWADDLFDIDDDT